ncbi:hypothetical protein [Kaistia nematophila]|uniref:Uncharacterized protein n=1 Tax=Kaistia nematophila TaxID=2994654 RepID=A0A9X3DYQ1_9HYPH|nr:hypothetical protein [Kaistia nematophila]MCX5568212.1 hypothetical protein [Kaistia nematophila]
MSYRSWLGCPHIALSTLRPRAGSARGEAGPVPRASTLILGLTVAISALVLAVDLLIRLTAAT